MTQRKKKKGSTPVELLVFIPIMALVASFAVFWSDHLSSSESNEAARNIAEIRASHEPATSKELELAYLRQLARRFTACVPTPSTEEWAESASSRRESITSSAVPVAVSVSCEGPHSNWLGASLSVAESSRPEARLAFTEIEESDCVGFSC